MSFDSATNRATNIGGLGVSYDAAGNMTSDGTNTYQWDAEGRLISVNNGSTWSATYNAFDQRVERISTCCGRTEELFDPSGHLLGHLNGANGIWWEEYVDFDGRLLWYYTQATNASRYFHVNALGSLGLATDQTGAPVEEMLYYPFGVRWQNTTGFGWDEKFAQFAQRDDDIQKYEASFREYDPGLGRWMSPDPLAGDVTNPQSFNRYAYVTNNPTTFNDPLGLCENPPPGEVWGDTVHCTHPHPATCNDMNCADNYYGGEQYAGDCTIDYLPAPCAQAEGLLRIGAALPAGVPLNGQVSMLEAISKPWTRV